MSRLLAKMVGLYYPTPEPVMEAIARFLKLPYMGAQVNLFDPCCGTGRALKFLAKGFEEQKKERFTTKDMLIHSYGIEPEPSRVSTARAILTRALTASFFATTLSDNWVSVALVNPPYDWDTESSDTNDLPGGTRLEYSFLVRSTKKLASDGVLVYIVPQEQLANQAIATHLTRYYHSHRCYRFSDAPWASPEELAEGKEPTPMYGRFQQVVLFAKKRGVPLAKLDSFEYEQILVWGRLGSSMEVLPDPQKYDVSQLCYQLPTAREPYKFQKGTFEPERVAALVSALSSEAKGLLPTHGVLATPEYTGTHWPDPLSATMQLGRPLSTLKNGHLAVLAVAGIANGVQLTSKDGTRRIVLKGHSTKKTKYSKEEDDDWLEETWTDTFETLLWGTDLGTGLPIFIETGATNELKVELYGTPVEVMSLATFMIEFGQSLTEQVAASNPPRYAGEESLPTELPQRLQPAKRWGDERKLSPENVLPWHRQQMAKLKRQPMGRQRAFIHANVNALINQHGQGSRGRLSRVGTIAEMATGKTYLSLATMLLAHPFVAMSPALVLCPPILVRKWKREAEITLPGIKCVIVQGVHTKADAAEFREFDPTFIGRELSRVGVLERVVVKIKHEQARYAHDVTLYEAAIARRREIMTKWKKTDLWEWKHICDIHQGRSLPSRPKEPDLGPIPVRPAQPLFLVIMSSSTAKLGTEWKPVYALHHLLQEDAMGMVAPLKVGPREDDADDETYRVAEGTSIALFPHCPRCCQPALRPKRGEKAEGRLFVPQSDDDEEHEEETPVAKKKQPRRHWKIEDILTEGELNLKGERRKKYACVHCGEPLWQFVGETRLPGATVTSTANTRIALADFIRKRYKGFFKFLIPDEIHEGADRTALYAARRALTTGTRRGTALTGTLCNGYSSSVFSTFYDLSPEMRRDFGPEETERWIDLFGMRKVTKKTNKKRANERDDGGDGAMSKRKTGNSQQVSEMPGLSPAALRYVLPYAGFLELGELQLNLPPYEENIHVVEMDTELKDAYGAFERKITNELSQMLLHGDKSGLGAWFQSLLGYPNMPYTEMPDAYGDPGGWKCETKRGRFLGQADLLPEDYRYGKERELVRIIEGEVAEGRRVLVYAEHTGGFDILSRLEKVIKSEAKTARPLRIAKLYSNTVETIDREKWLDDRVKAGCDVLLCNPKLVKVGLDLLGFPTIVFYEVPTSTSDMRQASRRSYRPGQKQRVKIEFLVYPTMEYRLLTLMARKMQTSLMVEGQLPGSGLVSFSGSGEDDGSSVMLQLARTVKEAIESGTHAQDLEVNADELQQMFRDVALEERHAQALLGEAVDEAAPLAYAAVATFELPTLVTQDGSVPHHQAAVSVTVIPTTSMSTLWEAERLKIVARKKKSKKGIDPGAPTLFGALFEEEEGQPGASVVQAQTEDALAFSGTLW